MSPPPPPRRRRRPALSCNECRRRKVRCDRNDPCLRCVTSRVQCSFTVLASEREEEPRGADLPQLAVLTPSKSPSSAVFPATTVTTHASPAHQGASLSDARELAWSTNPHIAEHLDGPRGSRISLYKNRTMNSSHWIAATQQLDTIYGCCFKIFATDGDDESALVSEIKGLHQTCKFLAKTIKSARPTFFLSWNDLDMSMPPREESSRMVAMYFRFFESSYRILHRPTFTAELDRYWQNPETASLEMRLKTLLVLAAGASMQPLNGEEHIGLREKAWGWVLGAQMWLSGPVEKDRLSIVGVQIHCLAILVRQNLNIGGDLLWDASGSLVQRAMQLGLHRDPKHLPPMSLSQAEIRRRLWATVLEIAVQGSLDAAIPPTINAYDTEPPLNMNDEDLDKPDPGRGRPKDVYTDCWMQRTLAETLRTRLAIVQQLNNFQAELGYEEVLALSASMTEILREKSKALLGFTLAECPQFHRNLLDYFVRRFLVPLHCSFAGKARNNPMFYYSLATSVDAALALVHAEPDEDFSRLLARGGGPYREGIMCAGNVICVELLSQTQARSEEGTLRGGSGNRETLKKAIEDLLALASERIQSQAETSIKGHMFWSTVLAQTEAIEQNADQPVRILRRVKESLQSCRDMLQPQVDNLAPLNSLQFDFLNGSNEEEHEWNWDVDFSFMP